MSLSFHTAPGQILAVPSISHPSALCHPGKETILLRRVAARLLWLLPTHSCPLAREMLRFQGWVGCGAFFLPHLPWQMLFPTVLLCSLGKKPPTKEGHEPLGLKYTAY